MFERLCVAAMSECATSDGDAACCQITLGHLAAVFMKQAKQ